jgi:TonB family protein
MIIIEFLVFVITSGLFFSERFRHNAPAVIVAAILATGSSLLFVTELGLKATGYANPTPPQIVKQLVRVPVLQRISQPPSPSKPENCDDYYPTLSSWLGHEGTTSLSFRVLADGTVEDVKVAQSSGHGRLDSAAVECVSKWHYRPAIKDGRLADMPWTASVTWSRGEKPEEQAKPEASPNP